MTDNQASADTSDRPHEDQADVKEAHKQMGESDQVAEAEAANTVAKEDARKGDLEDVVENE